MLTRVCREQGGCEGYGRAGRPWRHFAPFILYTALTFCTGNKLITSAGSGTAASTASREKNALGQFLDDHRRHISVDCGMDRGTDGRPQLEIFLRN